MTIDDRIPQMTLIELTNLHANATRLAASGSVAQKTEATRILPLVTAALEASKASKSAAMQKAKAEKREAADASRKKKAEARRAEKAAAAEAAE